MAFGIPNQADAGASALQSAVDAGDFDILVEAYNGDGVISGGAVTTSCGLALAVASGVAMVNGARVTIGSGTVTISTADACDPRIDLIHVTCGGVKTVTAGTAAAVPVYPAVPANSAVLAAVFVPAADTVIATAQIIDKRVIIQNIAAAGVADAIDLNLGTGADFRLRWSTADADNHAAVVALGQSNQVLHIAESCDIATDWSVAANAADSEVWIHSSTSPATDYLAIGRHTGTIATIDVQGGTTLNLDIAGNTELTVTAAGLNVPANSDINFTGTTGTNDIVLTNGLADALSITDGSADVVVVDTSTAGNVITLTSALTVGSDGSGSDLILYSATAGDNLTWDASDKVLNITGTDTETALDVLDGDVRIVDKLYFYDVGGEYISSNGSTLAITGATTVSSTLGVTGIITATAGVTACCDIDLNGNNIDCGGVIFLKEQADADADVAGSGQIWVDTATPNVLYFTDDAGNDRLIAHNATTALSSLVTVGALTAGSIACGFGAIDNGSNAITTTGLISGGSLDIDNVLINGTTIGHTCDTDLLTLGNATLLAKGTVTVGVDGTGHDVTFYGDSPGAFMLYDQSGDMLEIRGATAAGPGHLKLTTGEATVVASDVLGKIEFQAPAECGTDAVKVSATIAAVAQGTFAANVNATDLIFYTAHDCGVAERFRFTSQGEIGIAGANYGCDGQVLTSTGGGTAVAWEAAAGGGVPNAFFFA
jgi:hypothetical protein